ncbi:MAG: PorT family protein [Chitinophaga sp.]|uniref:porin family protein n=1 Tax=Chitinophaga sp. TaxID=1869181 RepID=UPI001B1A115D|nr:porin family protein [Chitinophaga sp.]MBO9731410.1 PorT family protein [Chitinophaga sp.]
MKKYLLLFIAALVHGLYALAQQQVTFGLKAGFSIANFLLKDEGITKKRTDTKICPAFQAGVIADIPLAEQLSLQPGLFFSQKGAVINDIDNGLSNQKVKSKVRLNYLEFPVNFIYRYQAGNGKLFVGLGAYVAYGLSGTMKVSTDTGSIPVKFRDMPNWTINALFVKPFDAGANFMIGYELKKGLLFNINYSLGLVNTDSYLEETQKQRYISVCIGYLFK